MTVHLYTSDWGTRLDTSHSRALWVGETEARSMLAAPGMSVRCQGEFTYVLFWVLTSWWLLGTSITSAGTWHLCEVCVPSAEA